MMIQVLYIYFYPEFPFIFLSMQICWKQILSSSIYMKISSYFFLQVLTIWSLAVYFKLMLFVFFFGL